MPRNSKTLLTQQTITEEQILEIVEYPLKYGVVKTIDIWRKYLVQAKHLGAQAHFKGLEQLVEAYKDVDAFFNNKFYVEVWLKYVNLPPLLTNPLGLQSQEPS